MALIVESRRIDEQRDRVAIVLQSQENQDWLRPGPWVARFLFQQLGHGVKRAAIHACGRVRRDRAYRRFLKLEYEPARMALLNRSADEQWHAVCRRPGERLCLVDSDSEVEMRCGGSRVRSLECAPPFGDLAPPLPEVVDNQLPHFGAVVGIDCDRQCRGELQGVGGRHVIKRNRILFGTDGGVDLPTGDRGALAQTKCRGEFLLMGGSPAYEWKPVEFHAATFNEDGARDEIDEHVGLWPSGQFDLFGQNTGGFLKRGWIGDIDIQRLAGFRSPCDWCQRQNQR